MHKKIIIDLKNKLASYDYLLLFLTRVKPFEAAFAQSQILKNYTRKIWIYSPNKVRYPNRIPYGWISPEEEAELLRLYYTYEFSDKFQVISEAEGYGSLFHYIDTNLLTVEEAIEALLY